MNLILDLARPFPLVHLLLLNEVHLNRVYPTEKCVTVSVIKAKISNFSYFLFYLKHQTYFSTSPSSLQWCQIRKRKKIWKWISIVVIKLLKMVSIKWFRSPQYKRTWLKTYWRNEKFSPGLFIDRPSDRL